MSIRRSSVPGGSASVRNRRHVAAPDEEVAQARSESVVEGKRYRHGKVLCSAAAVNRIPISLACSSAPSTSPVWPPICRMAIHPDQHARRRNERQRADRACDGTEREAERRHADGSRRRGGLPRWRAGIGGEAVAARRRHRPHEDRQDGTRACMRRNERKRDRGRRHQGGERAPAQHQRQHERRRPVGAEAAVAHDLELAGTVAAAAEAVRHIGQPVLMEASGQRQRRGKRERGSRQPGKPERRRRPIDERSDAAHQRACKRQSPGRARESAGGGRDIADGQAGAERDAAPEVVGKAHRQAPIGSPLTASRPNLPPCRNRGTLRHRERNSP